MELRPLEYESLKVVLEHMDANLRFQLFTRIPSIRNVERIVPLKIERLRFDSSCGITVNDAVYQLGIYKSYSPSEKVPVHAQKSNRLGGLQYDIDRLGFQDYSIQEGIEPGDILMHPSFPKHLETRRIAQQRRKQNVAQFLKNEEERIKEVETKWKEERAKVNAHRRRRNRDGGMEMTPYLPIQNPAVAYRAKLEPYYHLRDNTLPKYGAWIQLSIKSTPTPWFGEGKTKIERVKYNQKLHVAQKYLSNVLFGGRKTNIRVKKLEFFYSYNHVIRFPFGLKLKIRELDVESSLFLEHEKLMSLIDDSSYPLQQFIIEETINGLHFPIIETAQKLIIRGFTMRLSFQDISNLSNKNITWLDSYLSAHELFLVVQNWLESSREVGTEYVFAGLSNEVAGDLSKIMVERIHGVVVYERYIIIPMKNEAKKIKIWHQQSPIKMEIVRTFFSKKNFEFGTTASTNFKRSHNL